MMWYYLNVHFQGQRVKDIWKNPPTNHASGTQLHPESCLLKNSTDAVWNWTRDLPACSSVPPPPTLPRDVLLDSGDSKLYIYYVGFQANRNEQQTNNSRDDIEQNDTSQKQKEISTGKQSSKLNARKEMGICTKSWRSRKTKENTKKTKKYACDKVSLMLVKSIGLFVSPSGISELDCATTKTDTA